VIQRDTHDAPGQAALDRPYRKLGKSKTGVHQDAPWPDGFRETKVEAPERQVRWTTDAKGRRVKVKAGVTKRYGRPRVPWVPRGTGRQKQSPHRRRVICYMDEALYARLQTASWVRAQRLGTTHGASLGQIMRDVLELALPQAVDIPPES
jgi:hypothetical protein